MIRAYGGKSHEEILAAFYRDAELLLIQGYEHVPPDQHYLHGAYGCSTAVVAVLLIPLGIGILLLAWMLLGPRPAGTLVVRYVHRAQAH